MAKFSGSIGFAISEESEPGSGIWIENVIEKHYTGDVINVTQRWQNADKVNDDLNISNKISIVANTFACKNSYAMRYVIFMGTAWKITNIDVRPPRLILTIGGVYNGKQATTAK